MPNTKKTNERKIHIETIAYDRHHDQPEPITTFSFTDLVFVTDDDSPSSEALSKTNPILETHNTSQNVHILELLASKWMRLDFNSRSLFLILHLNPWATNLCI
jgi:hypothetical protein